MSCDSCKSFKVRISSPKELTAAIRLTKDGVESGLLQSIGAGMYGDAFSELSRTELWGDFVNNYFRCPACGQLFNLHAETYHGSGGALEAVDRVVGELRADET